MAASSPKTLLEQGHQLKYLPRSVPPAPERPERTDRQYEGFSPRRAATGASAAANTPGGQGQAERMQPACTGLPQLWWLELDTYGPPYMPTTRAQGLPGPTDGRGRRPGYTGWDWTAGGLRRHGE